MKSRLALLICISALTCASSASAQSEATPKAEADPLAGFYGNTLRISVQDYRGLRFFEPDHTYHDRVGGKVFTGTWSVEGDRICTQAPNFNRFCNLGAGKAVGEKWVDRDPYTGNKVTLSLVAGRKDDR